MLSGADLTPAAFPLPPFPKSSSSKLPVALDGFTLAAPLGTRASILDEEVQGLLPIATGRTFSLSAWFLHQCPYGSSSIKTGCLSLPICKMGAVVPIWCPSWRSCEVEGDGLPLEKAERGSFLSTHPPRLLCFHLHQKKKAVTHRHLNKL